MNGKPHNGMAWAAYRPSVEVFRDFAEAGVGLYTFNGTPTEAGYGLSKTVWTAPDTSLNGASLPDRIVAKPVKNERSEIMSLTPLYRLTALAGLCGVVQFAAAQERLPHIEIRGIYGGVPTELLEEERTLEHWGINAVWIGSGSLTAERVALIQQQKSRVFAEFNTLHEAGYLKDYPDAAPIGVDGKVCPPPKGWQGICPTHPGYRQFRMEEFRRVLRDFEIDGIWLDYHHSHASWERDEPEMPDTCFCQRCVDQFSRETKTELPDELLSRPAELILSRYADAWAEWRCGVFTDWVRQFRAILDETRPQALLGTFHCPWSDTDFDGALRKKLAIDLKAQAPFIDVFSSMPYHARFGHVSDPKWISRQTAWLGQYLDVQGEPGERIKIWPIVQLADWGEKVPVDQVATVLDHGTRRPATGIIVFHWGAVCNQKEKVAAMTDFYRRIKP